MLFPSSQRCGLTTFDTPSPTEKGCIFLGTFALSSAAYGDVVDIVVATTAIVVGFIVIVDIGRDDGVVNYYSRFGRQHHR